MEITTTNGQFYYDLFYFLAIVFTGVFFMIDGKRKNYPLADWALIFSSGIIFLIVGTKLFTYTPEEWKIIFETGIFPYTEKKTILGGIVGGIAGIWIAKSLIRFPYPVLDSFAVSFPVAMALQRIGCFMVGCCFGTPTDVPWAVSYSSHAIPYFIHLNQGWIMESSCSSLPVHPNQLYQTVLCLCVAFVVWKLKNKWKKPGNLFFTSIVLYWAVRFGVEFWRDSSSNGMAGMYWLGLKYVQWALLAGVFLMTTFIFIRERRFREEITAPQAKVNPVWYFIVLCSFVLVCSNWFTKTEFLFIELVLAPVTLFLIHTMFKQQVAEFRYRLASVYSLLFIFVLSGTVSAQRMYNDLTSKKTSRNIFNDVTFGYGNGQYSHWHSKPIAGGGIGCGANVYYLPVGPLSVHHSNVFAVGISHLETYGEFQKLTLNGELTGGWDKVEGVSGKKSVGVFDLASSVQYDFRWIGLGLGAHTGKRIYESLLGGHYYSLDDKLKSYTNLSWSLRFFPYDICYLEFRQNESSPHQIGNYRGAFQSVIGSGLGSKNGSGIEVGSAWDLGGFFSAKAIVKNKYGFKATVYFNPDPEIKQVAQFSVSYRFNSKHFEKEPAKKVSMADKILNETVMSDSCDVIVTKKGKTIRCNIMRETSNRIFYIECIAASQRDTVAAKEEKFILRTNMDSYARRTSIQK